MDTVVGMTCSISQARRVTADLAAVGWPLERCRPTAAGNPLGRVRAVSPTADYQSSGLRVAGSTSRVSALRAADS